MFRKQEIYHVQKGKRKEGKEGESSKSTMVLMVDKSESREINLG